MNSVSHSMTSKQLPNCVREAFLGIGAVKTAMLLDLLFTLGYKPGQWVTYQECLNVCRQYTSKTTIYEGLHHFTMKRKPLPQENAGRPTFAYVLPSFDALKHQLVVEWSHVSDQLLLSDMHTPKSYRMALHRELIARNYAENKKKATKFSRKFLSERLGCSPETLRSYERELGTWVNPTYGKRAISKLHHIYHVPEARAHNGRFLLIHVDGNTARRLPAIKSIAGLYLKKGYEMDLCWRECNEYAPYSPYSEQGKIDNLGEWADIFHS